MKKETYAGGHSPFITPATNVAENQAIFAAVYEAWFSAKSVSTSMLTKFYGMVIGAESVKLPFIAKIGDVRASWFVQSMLTTNTWISVRMVELKKDEDIVARALFDDSSYQSWLSHGGCIQGFPVSLLAPYKMKFPK